MPDIWELFEMLNYYKAIVFDIEHYDRLDPDHEECILEDSDCDNIESAKEWYLQKVWETQEVINKVAEQRLKEGKC